MIIWPFSDPLTPFYDLINLKLHWKCWNIVTLWIYTNIDESNSFFGKVWRSFVGETDLATLQELGHLLFAPIGGQNWPLEECLIGKFVFKYLNLEGLLRFQSAKLDFGIVCETFGHRKPTIQHLLKPQKVSVFVRCYVFKKCVTDEVRWWFSSHFCLLLKQLLILRCGSKNWLKPDTKPS